ncbi:MAG: serine/threonine protein kinase [Phycisphaeraceae bacterium]|nr:serine/threonine protein kinase [Phycisphaeraceae bacterium]
MSIACPHCGNKFVLKAAAGVYQPDCPECSLSFVLMVPRDEGKAAVTAKSLDALKAKQAQAKQAKAARHNAGDEQATVAEHDLDDAPAHPSQSEAATIAEHEAETLVSHAPAHAGQAPPVFAVPEGSNGQTIGQLDGYELLGKLGHGGMGNVYLARQLSLDRQVAVKTIHPHLSQDPVFLSRFVREAFAVAQLSHHNVVQIYDVGQDEQTHYFSMELVPGRSLAEVVQQTGPLEPKAAVMYVLHAARGLAFAHEHRMVHRDVKPANLLLSESGLVKVADLGLVKTDQQIDDAAARSSALSGTAHAATGNPATNGLGVSVGKTMLGTPAYMAPEQAADATKVDARADIYALGGTLYHLVTGKLPFPGKTVKQLIRNHREMPLVPPTKHNPRLPASLSKFIEQMLAKDPAKRPQTMAEVVQRIEAMLKIPAGPFTPRAEHVAAVESAADGLRQLTPAKVKRGLVVAFHAGCALLFALGIGASSLAMVSCAAVLWAVTIAAYQVTFGLLTRDALFTRCRRFAMGVGWMQWLVALGGVVSFSVMMVAIGLQWAYAGALIGGGLLGLGFYFGIERWADKARKRHIMPIQAMLSELRRHGVEEKSLRQFVCRYAGRRWEHLYEQLFGYDQKLEARRLWGYDDEGNARPHHAGYRDILINRLDRAEQEGKDNHLRQHVQRMEMRRLRAEGIGDVKALAEARHLAREFADNAAQYRETKRPKSLAEAYHNQTFEDGVSNQSLEAIPESWKLVPTPWTTVLMYWFFGARGRFMVGSVILLVWAMWAAKSDALPTLPESGSYLEHLRTFIAYRPEPLALTGIPPAILAVVCTPGAMFAGLLLMASAIFRGLRMTIFILPIVIMLLRAPFMSTSAVQLISPLEWTFLIALLLTPPGLIFGRVRD